MKLCLLDDSAWVFELFVPLFEAQGQEVKGILHEGKSAEEAAREIIATGAETVLIDGNLHGGVRGFDVCTLVKKANPRMRCIGFSNDPAYASIFLQAGADGFVHKRADDAQSCVREVMDIVSA